MKAWKIYPLPGPMLSPATMKAPLTLFLSVQCWLEKLRKRYPDGKFTIEHAKRKGERIDWNEK